MAKKTLNTLADVELAMNQLQRTRAEINAKTSHAYIEIADIRDGIVKDISSLEEDAKRLEASLETWAEENREDYFQGESKTLDLHAGTISFRMGTPALVLLEGWKTNDVVDELKKADAAIKKAGIKQPDPTLDKTAIKKLYDQGKIDDKTLRSLGLAIKQEESILLSTKTLEAYA